MRNRYLKSGASVCLIAAIASMFGGCGGGNICDVDFEALAGTYTFTMSVGGSQFTNSCFENYDVPDPDPATLNNCKWVETNESETITTIELVVTDDGNIGQAKITNVIDGNGQAQDSSLSVKCEMTKGELCNAPVRCNISGSDACSPPEVFPDEWTYSCNCTDATVHDPAGAACQACKAEYEKYQSESTGFCQKNQDSQFIEFTLNVK